MSGKGKRRKKVARDKLGRFKKHLKTTAKVVVAAGALAGAALGVERYRNPDRFRRSWNYGADRANYGEEVAMNRALADQRATQIRDTFGFNMTPGPPTGTPGFFVDHWAPPPVAQDFPGPTELHRIAPPPAVAGYAAHAA